MWHIESIQFSFIYLVRLTIEIAESSFTGCQALNSQCVSTWKLLQTPQKLLNIKNVFKGFILMKKKFYS